VDVSDKQDGSQLVNAVPCKLKNSNASLTLTFGGDNGIPIRVPMAALIGNDGPIFNASEFADSSGGCDLGLQGPIEDVLLIGDTVLRSMYAMFDTANKVVALAQAKTGGGASTASAVQALGAGPDIPGVTRTAAAKGTLLPEAEANAKSPIALAKKGKDGKIQAGKPTFKV
jgi:hypothetical protein